jgi:hypothetical protein
MEDIELQTIGYVVIPVVSVAVSERSEKSKRSSNRGMVEIGI